MSDRNRLSVAVFFYAISALLPFGLLATTTAALLGWIHLETSAWAILAVVVLSFLIPFSIATLFVAGVKSDGWLINLLPFLAGAAYAILPDPILFALDDALALGLGAVLTSWLAIRKNPNTPRWVIIPMLVAAVYALLGGFVPGWLDELIVDGTALAITLYGIRKRQT